MQNVCTEIQIKIINYLSERERIRFSEVSKYFLVLIRGYHWYLVLNMSYERIHPIETVRHLLATYQFQKCHLRLRYDLDEISYARHVEILDLHASYLTGKNLHLFDGLLEISLENCRNITDTAIINLCRNRTNPFRKINLSTCLEITDLSLDAIARVGCEELILNRNEKITDYGVHQVISSGICRKLSLEICSQITDAAFENAIQLRSLNLFTRNIWPKSVLGPSITDLTMKKLKLCQELSLNPECEISDAGLIELRSCTYLILAYHHLVTSEGLIAVLNYGNIKKLMFNYENNFDELELENMFPDVKIEVLY